MVLVLSSSGDSCSNPCFLIYKMRMLSRSSSNRQPWDGHQSCQVFPTSSRALNTAPSSTHSLPVPGCFATSGRAHPFFCFSRPVLCQCLWAGQDCLASNVAWTLRCSLHLLPSWLLHHLGPPHSPGSGITSGQVSSLNRWEEEEATLSMASQHSKHLMKLRESWAPTPSSIQRLRLHPDFGPPSPVLF